MHRIVYGFFYLLSLLPLPVLYLFTDAFYVLVCHVFGYRKQVVMQNLTIAFPEKSEEERKKIAKGFYRNFTDYFAETIKLFSASPQFIRQHFEGDYSIVNHYLQQGKKCQVHLGHNFNWEMGYFSSILHMQGQVLGVYMPLSNKTFETIFQQIRQRLGGHLLPANDLRRAILPFRNQPYALLLIADQSPGDVSKAQWINFFGRPTAFLTAPENGARIGKLPVVFCAFNKVKRGRYKASFQLATEDASLLPKGQLTKMYARFLEEKMKIQPELWLWSHRRWKHQWKEEYGEVK